ncbi:hypothetical protein A2767_01060 [Candidatus Roizmanbacteria bacterium RIFCSPHIGHO2_01_FULL_35_10]|uniref:DUF4190 domain-containing protein n=1 Tax=Candidatus Roizmanbacteria bacterium RIFCSPLOWO2_01_FULL_35_13 TaxID=1802055 RepID=A0A1F7IDQ4_9BACT|nr:MAG: hypothetical protein A2767_01060 [Candidatus Roizmanbacteria bacterium RIFCSPHIGHO2_01_FULL_35_10]OGK41486.1 MAG: hypothetical protein A3A74_05560 [Candidatus Roizmanbacteria bacterium RIFCSPLOWO2_01_FULL_35_13]
MKLFFIFLFLLQTLLTFSHSVFAQATPVPAANRFAACDLCGLCPPDKPPSTWEKCRACLYPNASTNPITKDTLKVTATTNTGPTPQPGRQYTVIGCIKTNLASFNQEGAAASVVQVLLNIIFSLIGGIAFLYLMYGSFTVLTSQAEPEKLNYGKRLIVGAIVGLTFSLLSAFIVNFIASGILKIPGF